MVFRHLTSRLVAGLLITVGLTGLSSCITTVQAVPRMPTPITLLHLGYASRINVTFSDSVLTRLESAWYRYDLNVYEPEHAYCLTNYTVTRRPNEMIDVHVIDITPAANQKSDPISVQFECGALPALHTHPPEECTRNANGGAFSCKRGHPDIILCIPSDTDLLTSNTGWHRFGILQCGRSMFTVYTPDAYAELQAYFGSGSPSTLPDSSP